MKTEIKFTENPWLRFLILMLVWGLVGTLFTVQSYVYRLNVGQNITWWELYPSEVFYFLFWGFCTLPVIGISRRFRVGRKNWASRLPLQIIFAILFAIAQRFVYELIVQNLNATPERPFSWERLNNNVIGFSDYGFFIYLIIVFVEHTIAYYKQMMSEKVNAVRLQEELTAAQLQALKMQLQPHFLFNTLNTISVLIQENPQKAEQMLAMLSDLLRLSLQQSSGYEIALKEELTYLQLYLQIEQVRFGDRLKINIQADPETLEARVPTFILQPLVENAIKHGISRKRGEGFVEILTKRRHEILKIWVNDNGNGVSPPDASLSTGIGLTNTTSRLTALYGDKSGFLLSNPESGGTSVEISIPFHTGQSQ